MWDRKRQIVWIAAGLILGTYISYSDSLDEQGNFVPRFFIFMETLVLIIMGVLFFCTREREGKDIADFQLPIADLTHQLGFHHGCWGLLKLAIGNWKSAML